MIKKQITTRTVVLLCIFMLLFGVVIGQGYFKYYVLKEHKYEHLDERFKYVKSILDEYYLYASEVKPEQYNEAILKGLVHAAGDPYTRYISKTEYDEFNIAMKGSFGGIGITASQNNGNIEVGETLEGKPAEVSGLKKGDIITHINGEKVNGITFEEALGLMRGEVGTDMELTIQRDGENKPLILKIKRDEITLNHVTLEITEEKIGYIKYKVFSENSVKQFDTVLEKIKKENINDIIIDLRGNHGGLVESAKDVAQHFLEKDSVVFYENFNKGKEGISITNSKNDYNFNNIIILIDRETASAAEILAASLKENDKAILVGEKTYGKGLTQQVFPLDQEQAISITVSEYLTPNENKVHGIGISPNIKIVNTAEELVKGVDAQYNKAIEVIKDGR